MGDTTNTDTALYEQYVRDCLSHLYDYTFLQDHPFPRLLLPNVPGNASRVQAFRDLVLDAIESLKPPEAGDPLTKDSRIYNILVLRYKKQQQVQFVLSQLNLGERQFYRDHAKAIQVVARVLSERLPEGASASATALSIQSELERVHSQDSSRLVTSEDFLQKALGAIRGLCERYKTEISVKVLDDYLPVSLDQTLLRQVVIWIVSELIVQSPQNSRFIIGFDTNEHEAHVTFKCDGLTKIDNASFFAAERNETLHTLVDALNAHVRFHSPFELILEIPIRHRAILVVDDNPDAIALFRQYLTGHPYQLFAAHDGQQAIELAHEAKPEVIILDVLLPNQDGWETLQNLKNHPSTLYTPVLICSVLDARDLAAVLGADGFLHKPPSEQDFLAVLEQFSG